MRYLSREEEEAKDNNPGANKYGPNPKGIES
jgi:hypothetical protein